MLSVGDVFSVARPPAGPTLQRELLLNNGNVRVHEHPLAKPCPLFNWLNSSKPNINTTFLCCGSTWLLLRRQGHIHHCHPMSSTLVCGKSIWGFGGGAINVSLDRFCCGQKP